MESDTLKHFQGIYDTVRARFSLINQAINHSPTKGEENEEVIRELLIDYLPKGYGIGSGIVVGADGKSSKQQDIVIYDNSLPDYTLSRDSKLFFADSVIATIEIKTTYSKKKLEEAIANIASVKQLALSKKSWMQWEYRNNEMLLVEYTSKSPIGIIFFYSTPLSKSSISVDTFVKNTRDMLKQVDKQYHPNLIFSLGHAASARYSGVELLNADIDYSVYGLYDVDHPEVTTGLEVDPNVNTMIDLGDNRFKINSDLRGALLKDIDGKQRIFVMGSNDGIAKSARVFPVGIVGSQRFFLDPMRSFVNFLMILGVLFRLRAINPYWSPEEYLPIGFTLMTNYKSDLGIDVDKL